MAKFYFFFGIPKRDGTGLEILRPSLADVALALGIVLADIQMLADREDWVESREMFLVQHQTEPQVEEWGGSQVRSCGVEWKVAKSYFFFGIPKRNGTGLEILRPSLVDVALALGIALADIQMMADRENWVESREMFLA